MQDPDAFRWPRPQPYSGPCKPPVIAQHVKQGHVAFDIHAMAFSVPIELAGRHVVCGFSGFNGWPWMALACQPLTAAADRILLRVFQAIASPLAD
jgi:hypothetical protein